MTLRIRAGLMAVTMGVVAGVGCTGAQEADAGMSADTGSRDAQVASDGTAGSDARTDTGTLPVVDLGTDVGNVVPDGGEADAGPPDMGTDSGPTACPAGSYRPASGGACLPWTECVAGQFVETAGTDTSDRVCTACATGTFSTGTNAASCGAWTACNAGQFVMTAGSATADQACGACATGTFSAGANAASCAAWSNCTAGQFVMTAGSATADRVCTACATGTFSTGTNAASCGAWTACTAGQFVMTAGSATADQACSACVTGTFSTGANAPSCTAWSNCTAGQFVMTAGSATADRVCTPCTTGTFSTGTNAASCGAWTACTAGQFVMTAGTAMSNRVCAMCATGYTTMANAPACTAWTDCVAGQSVATAGTATADRTCSACAAGRFTSTPNQSTCASWTVCGNNVVRTPGSATADRVCCAANRVGSDCSYDTAPFTLAYDLQIPAGGVDWNAIGDVPYATNNTAAITGGVGRVAYLLELDDRNVWVEMDDFTSGQPARTGVPTDWTFDRAVSNLTVRANGASGLTEATNDATGAVEFWSNCYTAGSNGIYDHDDDITVASPDCYGSMQVHRGTSPQLNFSRWSGGGAGTDLGVGPQPAAAGPNPDWTFRENSSSYTGTRRLRVYIRQAPRVQANYTWGDGNDDWPVGSGNFMDVTSDAAGNLYALGTYGADIAVNGVNYVGGRFGGVIVSTTSTGTFRWATNFRAGQDATAFRVLYDATTDAVYVSGSGFSGDVIAYQSGGTVTTNLGPQNGNCTPFVARLAAATGTVVWGRTFLPAGNGCATGNGLGRASNGDILVAGGLQGSVTIDGTTRSSTGAGFDTYVVRLNAATGMSSGLYMTLGTATADEGNNGVGVAGLSNGNFVVVGSFSGGNTNIAGVAMTNLGNQDGFWAEFTSAGANVRAGTVAGTAEDRLQDVKVGPSGDYYLSGYYDTSAVMGTTTISGSSFGVVLARVSAATGNYVWVTGGRGGGNAGFGLSRIVVDSTETVRFALNTGIGPTTTLAGFPVVQTGFPMLVARVNGATGVASAVETLGWGGSGGMTVRGLAVLPDGRAAIVGFHEGNVNIDGVAFPWTNTTCCQSRDQFLAVLRPGL